MRSCSFTDPQFRKSPCCSCRGASRRVVLTYRLGCRCLSLTPQGRTTPPSVPCARGLSSRGDAVFSFWVLGLGVLLRSPSVAQTEPARGRVSLLRTFGQVTPVLLQLLSCQGLQLQARKVRVKAGHLVPEAQGAVGSERRPVRKFPVCLAAPEVERGRRAGEGGALWEDSLRC